MQGDSPCCNLYQVKYIEALGTGITDLLAHCKKVGLKRPLLEEVSGKFRIVLWRKDSRRNALRANVGLLESLIVAKLKDCAEGVKFADLQQLMPDYPRSYVQSVLRKLRKDGKIRSEGTTSSARWFAVIT